MEFIQLINTKNRNFLFIPIRSSFFYCSIIDLLYLFSVSLFHENMAHEMQIRTPSSDFLCNFLQLFFLQVSLSTICQDLFHFLFNLNLLITFLFSVFSTSCFHFLFLQNLSLKCTAPNRHLCRIPIFFPISFRFINILFTIQLLSQVLFLKPTEHNSFAAILNINIPSRNKHHCFLFLLLLSSLSSSILGKNVNFPLVPLSLFKADVRTSILFLSDCRPQTSPPIITHTAATPQDSPSTTLDDFPEFRYNVTAVTNDCPSASDSSPGGVSSTESTQKTSVRRQELNRFKQTPSTKPVSAKRHSQ
jgi:hypothetical protein